MTTEGDATGKPVQGQKRVADPRAGGCCWVEFYGTAATGWGQCSYAARRGHLTCAKHAALDAAARDLKAAKRKKGRAA